MKNNILNKIVQQIPANLDECEIRKRITKVLSNVEHIYSYLIYSKYKDNCLDSWTIEYVFSQMEEYNTLKSQDTVENIVKNLIDSRNVVKHVVGYKQPPIELMLEIYEPLIRSLALHECKKWKEVEFDDAYQSCRLVMLLLYKKNYYIHKSLLKRSFENYILCQLRYEKYKPEILSLESVFYKSDGINKELTIAETIPDESEEERKKKEEEEFIFNIIFKEVKDIIVELIGQRQFEQLLRDYGMKHTTPWSRKKMQQIKNKFDKLGITWKSFERYL